MGVQSQMTGQGGFANSANQQCSQSNENMSQVRSRRTQCRDSHSPFLPSVYCQRLLWPSRSRAPRRIVPEGTTSPVRFVRTALLEMLSCRNRLAKFRVGSAERLLQRQSSGALTVNTSPDFAAKWLVNRLGRFAEEHPSIDLRVSATLHHVDFAREDVDLAVRHGDGNWPGLDVVRLSSEQLFPVCSPKLVTGRNRLTRPADVLKFTLIHVDDRKDWSRWLEAAGVHGIELTHGPVLNRVSMAIDAAVDGQGIVLARTTLAATDLISGRLLRPFAEELRLSKTYWIVCPKATAALPKIVTSRDWLLAEAARDLRQLRKLGTG